MRNPISTIDYRASELTEEDDLEWMVEDLLGHFSSKIHSLSMFAYGSSQGVALGAFKEHSSNAIRNGLRTFLFKAQHWKSGRSIEPYIASCLSKMAKGLKSNVDFTKKVSVPVCPACKALGTKEFLSTEGKLLRCGLCSKESARFEAMENRNSRAEFEYRIRKVFSLHSRKGKRCPGCERFIPQSLLVGADRVSCPYDTCDWFGVPGELESMAHPIAQSAGMTMSLNAAVSTTNGTSQVEHQDFLDAGDINPDLKIEHEQTYRREHSIIKSVMETQRAQVARLPRSKNLKKFMMYKAFESLLEEDPAAMVTYLTSGKTIGEPPYQSLIFQRYAQLIENCLPFEIDTHEGPVEVFSLLDANLDLFLGMSEFKAIVPESGIVPNNTHEIFVGKKCKGSCYIGMLCDVQDENGTSLLPDVESYAFSSIKMSHVVPAGTMITVTHMRLPPHHEMFSLVNLQRVRRKIIDSVYKRLHGEARPLKSAEKVVQP